MDKKLHKSSYWSTSVIQIATKQVEVILHNYLYLWVDFFDEQIVPRKIYEVLYICSILSSYDRFG